MVLTKLLAWLRRPRPCRHQWHVDHTTDYSGIIMQTCTKCGISEIGFNYK